MSEDAEDAVHRLMYRRFLVRMRDRDPDPLLREVAGAILEGHYTWFDAMNSRTYGESVRRLIDEATADPAAMSPRSLDEYERAARELFERVREEGIEVLDGYGCGDEDDR